MHTRYSLWAGRVAKTGILLLALLAFFLIALYWLILFSMDASARPAFEGAVTTTTLVVAIVGSGLVLFGSLALSVSLKNFHFLERPSWMSGLEWNLYLFGRELSGRPF